MGVIFLAVFVVAIVVGGGLGQQYIKASKEHNRIFRKDMNEVKERMERLEIDMAALKELVTDTIIADA